MKRVVVRLLALAGAVIVLVPVAAVDQIAMPVDAASALVTCTPQPAGAPVSATALSSYTAINPVRLVDTRNDIGGVRTPIDAGCTMRVGIGADIPSTARAVALSMTAVDSGADFFTVYPCASGRPETSNLNSRAGFATPNLVVAIPDANREICIFSNGRSNLIIDLNGWWSDGPDRFASVAPQRVYDSRRPGFAPLAPSQVREVQIPADVIATDATAAVVNLTAANGVQAGFMTAFPCGQPVPIASNVNFLAGEARAVGAIVGLGARRTLCVLADTTVHVIVDVTGYYGPAPGFGPTAVLEPSAGRRVVDSRNGIGGPKLPLAAGEVRSFDPVAGLADANDASAALLNFVSTDAAAAGFITAYPCGGALPDVSTLNFVRGEAATNLATVELGADRQICVVSSVQTNIIVDVFGVMTAPSGSPVERLSFDKPTWPTFDPSATDYVIECGAGTGTASVTMGLELLAFTSATLSVAGQPPVGLGSGSVTVPLRADQPLVVSTTRQGIQRDFHFRCVPDDFPKLEVLRPGQPTPGWYLTTFGFGSSSGKFAVIMDNHGTPVWYKRTPGPLIDFKKLPSGALAYTPQRGAYGIDEGQGYWVTNLQGGPTILRRTSNPVALPTDHHDYLEFTGGRTLVSYPLRPGAGSLFGGAAKFVDGVIEEQNDVGGNWTWTVSDHFAPVESTFPVNFAVSPFIPGFPDAWDVSHINALDREPNGDYVVTARHLDAVFRVDRDTKKIEWVLGGPVPSGISPSPTRPAPLTIVGDPYGGPKRPHDARLVGNVLTMMDNQAGMPGRSSRAVAYAIDTSTIPGTATMLWEFRNGGPFTGDTLGSAQQATDGSVLIGWGAGIQPMIEELAPNGTRLMAIGQRTGGSSYRTVKYPPGDFDVKFLRANAGGNVTQP